MNDLMPAPQCVRHGAMIFRPAATPEQAYCGVWYRCVHCASATLLPSVAFTNDMARWPQQVPA